MIDFVFLDVGGTLIDPTPSVGEIYARAGQPHGLDASPEALQRAFAAVWMGGFAKEGARMRAYGRDEPSTHEFWRRFVEEVFEQVGFEGPRDACFTALFEAFDRREAWRVYEDVAPLLAGLRERRLGCGILSNWDFRLPGLLDLLDLAPHFDPVVVSCFEGVAKPDPTLFRRAAERAGHRPERILYVGDHRDLDLEPALEVGFDAFLIEREGEAIPQDRVVRRLDALLEHIDAH